MIDINLDLTHWSINTLVKKAASPVDKSTSSGTIKMKLYLIKN